MTLKTVTLVVHNHTENAAAAGRCSNKRWYKVGGQEALENLLRRYKVDALVDLEYECQVTTFAALQENVPYALGETAPTVELELCQVGARRPPLPGTAPQEENIRKRQPHKPTRRLQAAQDSYG